MISQILTTAHHDSSNHSASSAEEESVTVVGGPRSSVHSHECFELFNTFIPEFLDSFIFQSGQNHCSKEGVSQKTKQMENSVDPDETQFAKHRFGLHG